MEANEAKQMEMLLQEGGIADDGTTVDPVSGNEVPPGSMAEEVRDDVPAQLSEGEYVVPADVTRYYGVKFFEDLRTEAKRGMGQMEADGRIGGEPVSQTMDNQTGGALTPEELALLQEMGMAVGGMVPPPEAVGNTGEYNKGGQVLYAQDGVDVTAANASTSGVNPYQAQFTQGMGSAFAPGYLSQQILDDYSASQTTQTSIVMLYSPEGIAVSVSLPAEQAKYDQLVAEGYTTTPVATTTETTVTTGNDDPPPPETAKPVNYTGMSEAELQKAYSQNQTAMAMMAGMAAINPIFGAFGAWATNSTKKKIEAEMKRQNFAVPEGGGIFDLSLGGIVDGIKDLLGLSEEETAKVVAKVGGGDDKTVTPTPTFTKEDSSKAAPNEASNVLGTSEDDSTTDSLANTVAAANAAAGDSGEVSGQVINAGTANQQVTGATQADIDYLTSAAAGNKGGLMNKKALNKKAKKKALNKQG
jgi:hypothetical protein